MEDNKLQNEEFFDETLEVSTEEEGSAEETSQEDMRLPDSELETVSGGAMKRDIFFCYYCNKKHTLYRYYPWSVRPAGMKKWYKNATKYVCDRNGTFFTLPLKSGRTAYFNESVQRLD